MEERLEDLMRRVEDGLLPGWSWLVRTNTNDDIDAGSGAYFANVCNGQKALETRDRDTYTNFAYGSTPAAALEAAFRSYTMKLGRVQ